MPGFENNPSTLNTTEVNPLIALRDRPRKDFEGGISSGLRSYNKYADMIRNLALAAGLFGALGQSETMGAEVEAQIPTGISETQDSPNDIVLERLIERRENERVITEMLGSLGSGVSFKPLEKITPAAFNKSTDPTLLRLVSRHSTLEHTREQEVATEALRCIEEVGKSLEDLEKTPKVKAFSRSLTSLYADMASFTINGSPFHALTASENPAPSFRQPDDFVYKIPPNFHILLDQLADLHNAELMVVNIPVSKQLHSLKHNPLISDQDWGRLRASLKMVDRVVCATHVAVKGTETEASALADTIAHNIQMKEATKAQQETPAQLADRW